MKSLCIMTEKFSVYYELSTLLKSMGVHFTAIPPGDKVPSNTGIVITTETESDAIKFSKKVIYTTPNETVARALCALSGKEEYSIMLVGIDPGQTPGIVLLGDGEVVCAFTADSPEDVVDAVAGNVNLYKRRETVVRVGNGDPTCRNRIVNALFDAGFYIEIVDERCTTRFSRDSDINAAFDIAKVEGGYTVNKKLEVEPPPGEIREIQRRSRILDGTITISEALARRVALGELTLKQAVKFQRKIPLKPRLKRK